MGDKEATAQASPTMTPCRTHCLVRPDCRPASLPGLRGRLVWVWFGLDPSPSDKLYASNTSLCVIAAPAFPAQRPRSSASPGPPSTPRLRLRARESVRKVEAKVETLLHTALGLMLSNPLESERVYCLTRRRLDTQNERVAWFSRLASPPPRDTGSESDQPQDERTYKRPIMRALPTLPMGVPPPHALAAWTTTSASTASLEAVQVNQANASYDASFVSSWTLAFPRPVSIRFHAVSIYASLSLPPSQRRI